MGLDWPKARQMPDGTTLDMEGNLTSDDKPFSVIRGHAGSCSREDQYATFEEARAAFMEEAGDAPIEPLCPGCNHAPANNRQKKAPHRCSWCGYDHETGEHAQLVGA